MLGCISGSDCDHSVTCKLQEPQIQYAGVEVWPSVARFGPRSHVLIRRSAEMHAGTLVGRSVEVYRLLSSVGIDISKSTRMRPPGLIRRSGEMHAGTLIVAATVFDVIPFG